MGTLEDTNIVPGTLNLSKKTKRRLNQSLKKNLLEYTLDDIKELNLTEKSFQEIIKELNSNNLTLKQSF